MSRPRRVRPRIAGFVLFLGVVALTTSACTPQKIAPTQAAVLGEPEGVPLVTGQPAPGQIGQLGAITCASATHCWAVGVPGPNDTLPTGGATVIVATTDGGLVWTPQTVAGNYTPELSGVACATTSDCIAVGSNGSSSGVVVSTQDGGAHWVSATTPPGSIAVDSVECQGPSQCTAMVSDGIVVWSARTADLGQTWTRMGDLPTFFTIDGAISCTSGGTCLVPGYVPTTSGHGVGAISISVDGGQTWTLAAVPTGIGLVQTTDCPTATVCLAGGTSSTTVSDVAPGTGQLLKSVDGGHTWTTTTAPPVDDAYGLACPTDLLCAMVGTNWSGHPAVASGAVAQSRDGGSTFTASSTAYAPVTLTSIACASSKMCVAAGGDTLARITLLTPPRATHAKGTVPASGSS